MFQNILLLGGAGAIGRRLTTVLKENNLKAVVVDQNTSSLSNVINGEDLFTVNLNEVGSMVEFSRARKENDFVCIFLAGMLSNDVSYTELQISADKNINSAITCLTVLKEKIKHFIYISSISVYGSEKTSPLLEEMQLDPDTIYGAFKASGELLSKAICRQHEIPWTALRTTQLFGIESAKDTLPHRVFRNDESLNLKPLIGSTIKRDYLHIRDFTNALLQIIRNPVPGVFNLGSGKAVSLGEIVESGLIRHGLQMTHEIQQFKKNLFDQFLSIDKIRRHYSFQNSKDINTWIREARPCQEYAF